MPRRCPAARPGRYAGLGGALLAILLFAATGCASAEPKLTPALAEVPLPVDVVPAPPLDTLGITPEMKAWVVERVPRSLAAASRFELLLQILQAENGLNLRYDSDATLTAEEVFTTRRYNCLGLAHLVVALAREIGLSVYYLEASGVEKYKRHGDLVVLSGHVTVAWDEGPTRRIVEMVFGPRVDLLNGRRISDAHAQALHHVNLGAAMLRDGDIDGALPHLVTAVRLGPDTATAWLDLGVALRRRGQLDAAEAAYRRAIAAEPEATAPYDNLYSLLRSRRRDDAAAEVLKVVERGGRRNPWLLLSLGDNLLASGDRVGARRFYMRAQAAAPDEAAPVAAMAGWYLAGGDEHRARRLWRRAAHRDPTEPRLEPLAVRLGETLPRPATAAITSG
jgi:Flp pilus assembly protein TadD